MKIYYLINTFDLGGAETGLIHLIDQGFFAGHDLQVTALFEGKNALGPMLEQRGIKHDVLMKQPEMRYHLMPQAYFRLKASLREHNPDLLILSLPQANILGRLAARTLPCKVATFEHSINYAKKMYQPLLKLTNRHVHAVLYDSETTRAAVQGNYNNKAREWIYVPLVAIGKAKNAKRDYALAGPVRLFSTGRLVPAKNFPALIEACHLLREKELDIRLTIAGEGEERERLEGLIRKFALEKNISLPGFVRDWKAQALKADIYLQPSVREGLCISLIEAMSLGLPCIAANVGGIKDYGRHEANLLLLETPEAKAIAQAALRLANNAALRERLGKQAVNDVGALFGSDKVKEQLERAKQALVS